MAAQAIVISIHNSFVGHALWPSHSCQSGHLRQDGEPSLERVKEVTISNLYISTFSSPNEIHKDL